MNEIVIVPAYNRPEFLSLCLDKIREADANITVVVAFDDGYDKACKEVLKGRHNVVYTEQSPHRYNRLTKQSRHVMHCLIAAAYGRALVYLIEDDVMIGKDFFDFHRAIHAQQPNIFASILTRNHNSNYQTTEDVGAYYLSGNADYQSLGVCYKSEVINSHINPHFNEGYFNDPFSYCKTTFPASIIGDAFVEQDGLIRRIVEAKKLQCAFAHVPRAYHAGFYGKNRGLSNRIKNLPFRLRLEKVKEIIFSKENMRKESDNDYFYFDSEPVDLTISSETYYLHQCPRKSQ